MATRDYAGMFAYEGFQCKQDIVAVATDPEDAHKSVNYEYLKQCLLDCGINSWLVNFVSVTLMEITLAFHLGTWTSEPLHIHHVCPGLPQGSQLTAVLFNIYTTELAKTQPTGLGRTLAFANDALLYQTGYNRQEMVTDI